jgi:hypothetical protein
VIISMLWHPDVLNILNNLYFIITVTFHIDHFMFCVTELHVSVMQDDDQVRCYTYNKRDAEHEVIDVKK